MRGDGPGLGAGLLSSAILVLGLVLASWIVAGAVVESRVAERHVTLTRVAEQEVKADLALWSITIRATGEALDALQGEIDTDVAETRAFLTAGGFDEAEISLEPQRLSEDALPPSGEPPAPRTRYTLVQPLLVRSTNVDLVAAISRRTSELTRRGVAVTADTPDYVVTNLQAVSDTLRAEAAQSVRDAATVFADGFETRLDGLREAEYSDVALAPRGVPSYTPQEQAIFKTARVSATATFLIRD